MRIERVDDKTVKCFLSNEELREYDIDYKDFVLRSEKAKEIVQDIIEQAAEEVGYKPPKFAFDLQIMMLPDQGLILTFSEKDALDLENSAQLLQCLKEMKEIIQRAKGIPGEAGLTGMEEGGGTAGQGVCAANGGKMPGISGNQNTAQQAKGEARSGARQEGRPVFAVFTFENLRSVMEFAAVLPANLRVQSALYEMNDLYYLYLHKGGASYERYSRTCIQAMEFGSLYAAENEKVLYLEEHGQRLIAERALKKLRLN